MATWTIARKFLLQSLRRPMAPILLVIGPIALIVVLAQAFSGIFAAASAPGALSIGYHSAGAGELSAGFDRFAEGLSGAGVTVRAAASAEKGLRDTAEGVYQAFAELDEGSGKIRLTLNERAGARGGAARSLIAGFASRFGFLRALREAAPAEAERLAAADAGSHVRVAAFEDARRPRALDYFGITILTMGILYASVVAAAAVARERTSRTLGRIGAAPVTRLQFLAGTCLGASLVVLLQVLAVYAAATRLLGIDYGNDPAATLALLLGTGFFALALGLGAGLLFPDGKTGPAVLSSVIPAFIFLGGGYMRLPDNPALNLLSRLSPLSWANKALFETAFSEQRAYLLPALAVCLGSGILILAASAIASLRREEA